MSDEIGFFNITWRSIRSVFSSGASTKDNIEALKKEHIEVLGKATNEILSEGLNNVKADIQYDFYMYTDKNHGIYGGNTRLHLYKKMTNFINAKLGDKREKAKENEVKKVEIKG